MKRLCFSLGEAACADLQCDLDGQCQGGFLHQSAAFSEKDCQVCKSLKDFWTFFISRQPIPKHLFDTGKNCVYLKGHVGFCPTPNLCLLIPLNTLVQLQQK
jgi:hypothetical protein